MGKPLMKWNKIYKYCEDNNIEPEEAIKIVHKYVNKDGYRARWLEERFDLYAKERIKQKKLGYSHLFGSKIEAVRNVVNSKEFKEKVKKIPPFKHDHVHILSRIIADNRGRIIFTMKQAFKNNGVDEII